MRIRVKEKGRKLKLAFPTGLVLNRLMVELLWLGLGKRIREGELPITKAQAIRLIRAAKSYKQQHPDWVLVEAEGRNGDEIRIKL